MLGSRPRDRDGRQPEHGRDEGDDPMLSSLRFIVVLAADSESGSGVGGRVCIGAAILVVLVLLAAIFGGQKCTVCGTPIKRKSYRWKIDGKKEILCPKCNGQMERRQSRAAFKRRFG
jgi:hypothetical protein